MSKAISYIRFSSARQADGSSLARQTEAAAAYCERRGLTLDTSLRFLDLGVSGWSGANASTGALAALLGLVREGKVEPGTRLIVENLDRLSRQAPLDAFEIIRQLLKAGLVIVTLMDQQEYTSDSVNGGQVFILLGHLQRAHQESQVKSERCRDAWARKKRGLVEDRKPMTAHCPPWLRLSTDRSKYEPIHDAVKLVNRIMRHLVEGMGYEAVSKVLNAEGVPSLGKRAGRWYPSLIAKLAHNRQLIGEYQPHEGHRRERRAAGDPVLGLYPAVVDKSLFYQVAEATAARRNHRGKTGRRVNLFSGLLQDVLGSSWVALSVRRNERHRLVSSKAKAGVPGHKYVSLPLDSFEAGVCMMIRELWAKRAAPDNKSRQIDLLLGEVADVDARLGAVRDQILRADAATVTTLVSMVPELEKRRATLQAEAEKLQCEASRKPAALPSLMDELEAAPTDEAIRLKVRQAIREHVEQVRLIKIDRQRRQKDMPAGTWVAVEVVLVDGPRSLTSLFLPSNPAGPVIVRPLVGAGPIPEVVEKAALVHANDEHVMLAIAAEAR